MAFPDPRAVEKAIVATLASDPTLLALMPGGVVWDVGPAGLTAFVSVSAEDSQAEAVFGDDDDGMKTLSYLVKAVSRGTATDPPLDAAGRIHELLHRQTLAIATDAGLDFVVTLWARRVRYAERDPANIVWQHIGGVYDVMVSSSSSATV